MTQVKALDVSSHSGPVPVEKWRAAYDGGVRLAIAQAWGGLPSGYMGSSPHCRQQLAAAREAGLLTAIYVWIPPDTTTDTRVLIRLAKEAAGDEYQHVRFVALDVEDPRHRPLHPTSPDFRLANARDNVEDKRIAIYTSRGEWATVMRNSREFATLPLWDASWDLGDQLDVNFHMYGGWERRAALQYQGSTTAFGIHCDLNVADLERLGVVPPTPVDPTLYPWGLSLLTKRFTRIVASYPLDQVQQDDPVREADNVAAWQAFYDKEVLPRLDWMQRG